VDLLPAALVLLPLLAGLVLLAWRGADDDRATSVAAGVAAGELVLASVTVAAAAPYRLPGPRLELDLPWVPALALRLHLGLDGLSAPLVLLTGLLTLLVCWHLVRVRPVAGRARGLAACVLLVEGGAMATFTALDLLLFFVAFEIVLVPMWFVVAFWGDESARSSGLPPAAPGPHGEAARRDAAMRFILYTGLGSAVMLLGLLLVVLRTGTGDLNALAYQAGARLSGPEQTIAAALILLGLAVKAPAWPLHTWLPPAHTIAPTGGSVLLAGVLLKLGTYGMVRIVLPVLPHGIRVLAPWLGALGVAGILWGGLACLVERDLKRLIAMSSVAHMGFVLLGIASLTPQGLQGALYANVAHGLITGLLFLVVGALKDRHHSADLAVVGPGLRDRLPRLGWLLAFGAIAGIGLPGLAGFWGELLAVTGAWRGQAALGPLARPMAVLAGLGTLLAAGYLLRVLYLIWHGERADRPTGRAAVTAGAAGIAGTVPAVQVVTMGDATSHELAVSGPLVLATVALGLLPWLLLDLTGPVVRQLLALGGAP
jgi:NADH-quinone oxidoreductase subunit M